MAIQGQQARSGSNQGVLVTGAEGALGSVVAARFLEAGYAVWATHRPGHAPKKEAAGLNWIPMDLSDSVSVKKGLEGVGEEISHLAHCAGGFRYFHVEQTPDSELDFLMDSNLRSAFLLCRELIPGMKKRGFGRIVFVSSRATLQAPAGMAAYAASKAGLNMLTSSLADEVRSFDINVNAVLPSIIDTPANRKDMPKADFSAWVKPEELAEIIFSLTQPWGKPIHGALIPVVGRVG